MKNNKKEINFGELSPEIVTIISLLGILVFISLLGVMIISFILANQDDRLNKLEFNGGEWECIESDYIIKEVSLLNMEKNVTVRVMSNSDKGLDLTLMKYGNPQWYLVKGSELKEKFGCKKYAWVKK